MKSTAENWAASTAIVAFALLTPNPTFACMWDYDTLAMERAQFPEGLELITGKFARHSPEFYQWRIEDRLKRLETNPENLSLLDDLGVAYDKVGKHEEAIATMLRKEALESGRYETYANLGTFHIHSGELERGVEYIERAIVINPSAHFGRETYQKLLVEYVLFVRERGNQGLPLHLVWPVDRHAYFSGDENRENAPRGFLDRVPPFNDGPDAAVKGILGMMRFGNFDSPVLLEALGDLLLSSTSKDMMGSGHLATRAYLKAAYALEEGAAKLKYRELAAMALEMQGNRGWGSTQITLDEVEETFRAELAEADAWYAQVRNDELRWIEEGLNVDEMFAEKYYMPVRIEAGQSSSLFVPTLKVSLAIFFIVLFVWWLRRRRREIRLAGEETESA